MNTYIVVGSAAKTRPFSSELGYDIREEFLLGGDGGGDAGIDRPISLWPT